MRETRAEGEKRGLCAHLGLLQHATEVQLGGEEAPFEVLLVLHEVGIDQQQRHLGDRLELLLIVLPVDGRRGAHLLETCVQRLTHKSL